MDLSFILDFIPEIVSLLLGVGGVMVYVRKYYKPVKEVAELLLVVGAAVEDGKVTKAELDLIIKEAKDIPEAVKAVSRRSTP